MTWDSVPWFIGGGAQHSPEVARLLAHAATSGAEGIIGPGDLKVVPLAVPGASIRVLTGAALILSKAAGGAQQTYVGRNPSEDVKGIAATGSGSGRSDLVIAQIKDPFMPGEPWDDPVDPIVGPYIFTTIVPNVAPDTTTVPSGVSGIPLARIDIPANTGTITAAMIKDLREVALPWSSQVYEIQNGVGNGSGGAEPLPLSATSWTNWPSNALNVKVPRRATHAQLSVSVHNLPVDGLVDFESRILLDTLTGANPANFDHNLSMGGLERLSHYTFANIDVRSLQGRTVPLRLQARRTYTATSTGSVGVGLWEQVVFDVRFSERPV